MLTCSNCGNHQESGNFCESCGQSMLGHPQQALSNTGINKLAGQSKSFFHYAIERFKQPNLIFEDDDQSFPKTLVSFFLLPFFIATFIYSIINHVYKLEFSSYFSNDSSLPFFEVTSRLFLIFVLLLLSGYLANLVIMKIAQNTISNKLLFTKHFGIQVPFLFIFAGLTLLSMLGIVSVNPYQLENAVWILILFSILMTIIMTVNPIVITFRQLSIQNYEHSYYFTILSFLINFLFMYIVFKLIYDSLINEFINMF